jgi:N-methylhydantoinase B
MGVDRVKQLCDRFGATQLTQAFAAILKGAADELRAAIARLPEGTSTAEGYLDSDGIEIEKPIKLAVTITIKDGLAHFDFTNCAPQARGPVNLRPSMAEACVFYSLIGSLGPDIAYNDGMRDAVRIKYAPRTIVNAEPPGPVSSYQMVNLALADVILEALAHFNPSRAIAHSGASSALSIAWSKGRPRQINQQYEIAGSAYGGGTGHDGVTGAATHLSNLHSTPIEVLESEFPCRITRFDVVPDSGGAGRWRGGLAIQREYELLEDAVVIRRFNKTRFPSTGLAGGKDGARARFVVRVGSDKEFETKASARVDMKAGERFLLQSAGGGGYGDPHQRDRAALARDIGEGYVSKDAAARDYGAND